MVGTAHPGTAPDPSTEVPASEALPRPAAVRGPALVVLGIAVLIVVVGLIGAAVESGQSGTGGSPPPRLHPVTLPDGTTVALTPATSALSHLVSEGQPPSDILDHLAVPAGSRPTGTIDDDLSAGLYDRTASFTTSLTVDQVADTFGALLPTLGWQVIYHGPGVRHGQSGTEVLAKRGGSDGYEWEVGAVVRPTTAAGATPFSVELFQVTDDT